MTRQTQHSRAIIGFLAAALAIAGASALSAQDTARTQDDLEAGVAEDAATPGEQRLAKLLDGRIAGKPTRCISTRPGQAMQTINGVAYVYGSGKTIYVQRTRDPDQIRSSNILVSERVVSSQMCRTDLMRVVDQFTGIFMGAVFFDDFVPYTRVNVAGGSMGR